MRSVSYTIVFSIILVAALASYAAAPRVAFVWDQTAVSDGFGNALMAAAPPQVKALDADMTRTAIRAAIGNKFYNLTSDQGQLAATVADSDFIVFVKAEVLRRNSFDLGDHYEAWASVILIEGRHGTLVEHRLESGKGKSEKDAINKLNELAPTTIEAFMPSITRSKPVSPKMETSIRTVPLEGSPDAAGFVAPIPFKRIKPEYTPIAYLYSVTATVEIEIDLDETGKVIRTRIVRWAGFGLDGSVENAVRAMNWRPAYFGKTARPIRFVAQYNFRKPQ